MAGAIYASGDRVELRPLEADDVPFVQELLNDPRVRTKSGHEGPTSLTQERAWYERASEDDAIAQFLLTADGDPIGTLEFDPIDDRHGTAELAFCLHPDHQGRGYITEAGGLALGYAFDDRRVHRVAADVYAFNEASMRALDRLGFTEEGVHREAAFVDGEYVDVHQFGLLEDEWRTTEATTGDESP